LRERANKPSRINVCGISEPPNRSGRIRDFASPAIAQQIR